MTSHNYDDVGTLCPHIYAMNEGKHLQFIDPKVPAVIHDYYKVYLSVSIGAIIYYII